MVGIKFYVRVEVSSLDLLTACALLHLFLYPSSIREPQYSVLTMLYVHSVTCLSGNLLTGAQAWDLISM